MAGVMLIQGFNDYGDPMEFNDYGDLLPADMSGFGADGFVGTLKSYLPNTEELKEAGMAGFGVLGGLLGGIAIEKFVAKNVSAVPKAAYPAVHILGGVALGRVISRYNMPIGVGFASAMVGLGLLRALQTWFGYNVNLSGDLAALDSADMGDLADLLGDDNLLPPELSQVSAENERGYSQVAIENAGLSGYSYM